MHDGVNGETRLGESSTPAQDTSSSSSKRSAPSKLHAAPEQEAERNVGGSSPVGARGQLTKEIVGREPEGSTDTTSPANVTMAKKSAANEMDQPDAKRQKTNEHQKSANDVSQNGQKAETSSSRRQSKARVPVPTAAASRARRTILKQPQEDAPMSAVAASYLAPKVEPPPPANGTAPPVAMPIRSSALGASPAKMAPSPALEIFYRTPSESIALALNGKLAAASASTSALTSASGAEAPPSTSSLANGSSRSRTRSHRPDDNGRNPFIDVKPSPQPEAFSSQLQTPLPEPALSALYAPDLLTGSSPIKVTKTKKGKGRAKSTEDTASILNDDFCSSCNGIGRFLCCDGCPKSFHFYCLEPPLELNELPPEDEWFCRECRASKKAPSQRDPRYRGLFGPLVQEIDVSNPTVFSLPKDLKTFLVGVVTRPDGGYLDGFDTKAVRYDRSGFPEDRDSSRLKNKNRVILCHRCKMSAAPIGQGVAQGLKQARRIVSCDYCSLSWHLDCLEPPMINMPHPQRKWMCPNHAQHVAPNRKNLRIGVEEYLVDRPGQPNNGNIEILDDDLIAKQIECEEVYINTKRYKVPEKIVRLDFWAKVGRNSQSVSGTHTAEESSLSSVSVNGEVDPADTAAETLLSFSRQAQARHSVGAEDGVEQTDSTMVNDAASSPAEAR